MYDFTQLVEMYWQKGDGDNITILVSDSVDDDIFIIENYSLFNDQNKEPICNFHREYDSYRSARMGVAYYYRSEMRKRHIPLSYEKIKQMKNNCKSLQDIWHIPKILKVAKVALYEYKNNNWWRI